MGWSGHWHGYEPWTGTREEYGREQLRCPGRNPDDQQTRDFLSGTMPPVQTGYALLRVRRTSADRTWTTVGDAVDWLRQTYAERPPSGDYLPLEEMIRHDEELLPLGKDVVWAYYSRGGYFVSYSVICCPSIFHPDIPCPLPPVATPVS